MSRQATGAVLATLALAISVIALATLGVSGPGSRMGWWHFRIGFTLMQWAAYGAAAAAVVALLALIVGGRRGRAAVALVLPMILRARGQGKALAALGGDED